MSAVLTPAAPPAPSAAAPSPPLMTAEEFVVKYGGRYAELIDGVVVELDVPQQRHGKACNWAAFHITTYAVGNDAGHVTTNDSFVRVATNPDRLRGADVCFFSYGRLPKGELPEGVLPVAPDLVVEVRSPSETWSDVFGKVLDYLTAGVRAVVVLDLPTRSATVYRPDVRQETFEADAELVVPDVLPGFAVRVGKLFE